MTIQPPDQLLQKRFLPNSCQLVTLGRQADGWHGENAAGHQVLAGEAPASLDRWVADHGLRHIDWLTLHRTGRAHAVLEGATELLRLRRIDFIQFDGDEAGDDLPALYALLQRNGYSLFRFAERNLKHFRAPPADRPPCTHLAVAPRHWKRLFSRDTTMFDHRELFSRHGVVPRGTIHVGAHEGDEYPGYVAAGCRRVLFIEADPDTFSRLSPRFAGNPDVICLNIAVAETSGRAVFSRMSGDQANSLLRPKGHLDLYPHIVPTGTIEVETAPLPRILTDNGLDIGDYNVLTMDVQGAERLVLDGCDALLPRFDAVQTEVNYKELYEGCGLIADLDDRLFPHGFERVEEISPYHHSWGDAFYVRR
ncbi:FkbM family methyltransferase [Azospirillum agricola]|uniref:FkbM family methyltransferase n=1 Tax=Azospirillum agricola TaxID=1720247 RepID=UPI001AEB6A1A|nr:FkbM family methyltransferase [Azospirillum agricola]MBP2229183.1 FkbM family methyltransferase [Azospirillum agricola]